MSGDEIAWVVIASAGIAGAVALYCWLRPSRHSLVRMLLVGFALGFFLLPAPVPGYDGHIAPAFVVAIFELFMQIDGKPEVALRILVFGITVIGAVIWGFDYLGVRRRLFGQGRQHTGKDET